MLMFCQHCHDIKITCIKKIICVLGDVVYVTWKTIFVNTSGHGDHVGGRGPSGGDGAPQLRLGSIFRHPSFSWIGKRAWLGISGWEIYWVGLIWSLTWYCKNNSLTILSVYKVMFYWQNKPLYYKTLAHVRLLYKDRIKGASNMTLENGKMHEKTAFPWWLIHMLESIFTVRSQP